MSWAGMGCVLSVALALKFLGFFFWHPGKTNEQSVNKRRLPSIRRNDVRSGEMFRVCFVPSGKKSGGSVVGWNLGR